MKETLRNYAIRYLFSKQEKTAMINALYRRQDDHSTQQVNGDKRLRSLCGQLAKEFMNY